MTIEKLKAKGINVRKVKSNSATSSNEKVISFEFYQKITDLLKTEEPLLENIPNKKVLAAKLFTKEYGSLFSMSEIKHIVNEISEALKES